jgi:tetratricopeptide (TPR) repeat protein
LALALCGCAGPDPRVGVPAGDELGETLRLAEAGDPVAQTVIGNLYETDAFGAPDYGEAADWYAKAADQGDPLARYFLGSLYERGEGVGRDYARAAALYRASAEAGNPSAAFKLGYFHENGLGVARDFTAARQWYDLAEQGWGRQRVQPLQPEYLVVVAPAEPAAAQVVTLVPVASLAGLPVLPEQVAAQTADTTAASEQPQAGYYLHLASQRGPEAALAAWDTARRRFPDLLDGLQVALAKLDLGGGSDVFYQVLAGPIVLEEDADIICARLQPQGQYCDPVPVTP